MKTKASARGQKARQIYKIKINQDSNPNSPQELPQNSPQELPQELPQKLPQKLPIGLTYLHDKLTFDGQPLQELAQKFATPLYVYSKAILQDNARIWCDAMHKNFGDNGEVAYAVKANDRVQILQCLAQLNQNSIGNGIGDGIGYDGGCSADIVSEGELLRALAAGISPQKIIFSGCGKSDHEMSCALENGVDHINVESEAELLRLSNIAKQKGKTANVSLRVAPDIDAETHDKISTGRKQDKFGIEPALARKLFLRKLDAINYDGVAIHIGSQITKMKPFQNSFAVIAEWLEFLNTVGIKPARIDLGGGVGIDAQGNPTPSPYNFAQTAKKYLNSLNSHSKTRVIVEPGRSIAASAGLLLARVLTEKTVDNKKCLVLDVGMNDFMRVALYDATHRIIPLVRQKNVASNNSSATTAANVWAVGPVCESSDSFGMQKDLEQVKIGDALAITLAGAYGAVMASNYNARPRPAEILIHKIMHKNLIQTIRKRGNLAEEIEAEKKIAEKLPKQSPL